MPDVKIIDQAMHVDEDPINENWIRIMRALRLRKWHDVVRLSEGKITIQGAKKMADGIFEQRFIEAVRELDASVTEAESRLQDSNVESELRAWIDGSDGPIDWGQPAPTVTPDEWFFITTLYGEMNLDGQRTHIRKFFPTLFVDAAKRDVRNFRPGMAEYDGLRSGWMKTRLSKMADILHTDGLTMADYVEKLRTEEAKATSQNPTPALDTIVRDHRATGWKTLSVFVRDCVGGHCFPIDSRVARILDKHGLPHDERVLVSLSLKLGRNPRQVARLFYAGGG